MVFASFRQHGAHAHTRRKEARGLAIDQVEVLVERDALSELFYLQQFALDHLLRQLDQHVENAEVALLHGDLECLHVEPVAGEDAFRVSPLRVRGRTTAARLSFINDVVVHQRGGVYDLDHRSQLDGAAPFVAHQLRGKQKQRRTNALATAGAQMLSDLGDRADVRDGVTPEFTLYRGEVLA